MSVLARGVLRDQPEDNLKYSADFFKDTITARDGKIICDVIEILFGFISHCMIDDLFNYSSIAYATLLHDVYHLHD